MIGRLRAHYGAGPLHLIALVASFAIAGAGVVGWFQRPKDVLTVVIWFLAAAVLHDLVVLPFYSLVDRLTIGSLDGRVAREQAGRPGRPMGRARLAGRAGLVSPTPYLRIPTLLSALLAVVFVPVILGLGTSTELTASGIAERGYLTRWLLACGVMFAASGVAYAVAAARAARSGARANSAMPR